jgi:hypothetical protein
MKPYVSSRNKDNYNGGSFRYNQNNYDYNNSFYSSRDAASTFEPRNSAQQVNYPTYNYQQPSQSKILKREDVSPLFPPS